jgi:hypothetical protein
MKTILLSAIIFLFGITANAQEIAIKNAELPAESMDFIKKYFSKNTIHHAIKDQDKSKITYEVMLDDKAELEFTEKGAWKEVDGKDKAIPTGYILKPIIDYVKKNYPKASITHIDKGLNDIDIDLDNGIELEFDLKGKFLRIDK